jgi:hypothetical protein
MMNMNMEMNEMENMKGMENAENMEEMENMKDMEDDDRDLEALYPRTYFLVLPAIQKHLDDMESKHGKDHMPSKEEFEEMIEKIYKEVEHDVEKMSRNYEESEYFRQIAPFPGMLLRDMVGIGAIGEMGRRRWRRRPFYPYHRPPGYYGGYSPYQGYGHGPQGPYPGY